MKIRLLGYLNKKKMTWAVYASFAAKIRPAKRAAPNALPWRLPDISRASTKDVGAADVRGRTKMARRDKAKTKGSGVGWGRWVSARIIRFRIIRFRDGHKVEMH